MVRELSKHQCASCLIVAFVIARFALLSCYSSAKTRIRPVKLYQHYPIGNDTNNRRAAIRKKIRSMINRGVWRKTDRAKIPKNRRLIGNKWVFKIKSDGTYRARLVALGYSQIPGGDYTDNLHQWHMMSHSE